MTNSSPHPLEWIDEKLALLQRAGLLRERLVRQGPQSSRTVLAGQQLVNFSSNDYLGLAADPRVVADVHRTATESGWGSGASPLVTGRGTAQAALEAELARFEETAAALVFPTGYAANAGTIAALIGQRDAVFSDAHNHASIIDGCRLSRAKRFVYPHGDWQALAEMLENADGFRRRLIVTDSLFSMDGDFAPLVPIATLAEQHHAMLMVDEAHATGVFGHHGRGVVEHLAKVEGCTQLERQVHIRIGTLSKALGTSGGFVCGSQALIEWLANRARPYVYSTAGPAAGNAASLAALQIVREEPTRRQEVLARASHLRDRLAEMGWDTGQSVSQIVPVVVGEADVAMRLAAQLRQAGLLVPAIRPPSVPRGQSLLRISVCFHHTPAMIDDLLGAFGRLNVPIRP